MDKTRRRSGAASNGHRRPKAAPVSVEVRAFHKTKLGAIYLGDSLRTLDEHVKPGSVDLIMTSPPFGLVRKKDYGNVDSHEYLEWFRPFGEAFKRFFEGGLSFRFTALPHGLSRCHWA